MNNEEPKLDEEHIFSIERPHPNLMKLYFLRSIITGPFIIISLPVFYFRYHTLRYNFDKEGIRMSWGILFRREINLTYSRIQDIHLHSSFIQRWLKLADLKIQTAAGSMEAEMTIEGLQEFEELRHFIYTRMRGYKKEQKVSSGESSPQGGDSGEIVSLLREISSEIRTTREALEKAERG